MKAKELMIGDWVKVCNQYRPINGISHNSVEFSGYIANIEEIEPIPITPEILEKNGFKLDRSQYIVTKSDYRSKDNRILINHLSNIIGKDWYCHIDNEDFQTIGGADVQYVHELQHLLKLCGIDKEIIL